MIDPLATASELAARSGFCTFDGKAADGFTEAVTTFDGVASIVAALRGPVGPLTLFADLRRFTSTAVVAVFAFRDDADVGKGDALALTSAQLPAP